MPYHHLEEGATMATVVLINGLTSSFKSAKALTGALGHYRRLSIDPFAYLAEQTNEKFDLEVCVADISQLIENLDSPRTIVIGSGIGGLIAKKLTLTSPDLIDGEILLGVSGKPLSETLANSLHQIINFLEKGSKDKEAVQQVAGMFLGRFTKEIAHKGYVRLISPAFNFNRLRVLLQNLYCKEHFSENDLAAQKVPNLLIACKHDTVIHLRDVERLAKRIGTNRGMKVLEDTHNHIEGIHNDKLVGYITSFIKSIMGTPIENIQSPYVLKSEWKEELRNIASRISINRHLDVLSCPLNFQVF